MRLFESVPGRSVDVLYVMVRMGMNVPVHQYGQAAVDKEGGTLRFKLMDQAVKQSHSIGFKT